MRVNPSLRTIFIANSKAASTSVEKILDEFDPDPIRTSKHADAEFVYRHIRPYTENEYPDQAPFTTFVIVRNPIDRLYSWWRYRQRHNIPTGKKMFSTKGITFEEFCTQFVDYRKGKKETFAGARVRPQTKFIFSKDGKVVPDKVFAFDALRKLEQFLAERTGHKLTIGHHNRSPDPHMNRLLSDRQVSSLHAVLELEFEIFNLAVTSPDAVKAKFGIDYR